jgi:HSP20 family protein
MLPSIKRVDQDWLPTIFNDFFNHGLFPAHFNAFTAPAINIKETDKMFEIEMTVPGMTKDDFQVQVSEHRLLQISVQKKEEKQDSEQTCKYLRKDFSYMKFEQSLSLPENVDVNAIKAKVCYGVLTIQIPKITNVSKPLKPIEIQ